MVLARLRTIAILMCLMVTSGLAFQSSPANRPWPPGVQKVSDESPVLSPADALKTFYMPPGYHLELVASEPLVQDPTVIDWDLNGPAVGRRDDRLRQRPAGEGTEPGSDRARRRARRHQPRRRHGQTDGIRGQPDPASRPEGARPRGARRRARESLADARHERRSRKPTRRN